MYYSSFPIDPGKTVATITLPANASIHIFAVAIGDLPYDNSTGVSSDGQPTGTASFDGDGFLYSADALAAAGITPGGTVTSGGVSYTWPDVAPGEPDNIVADGQTIPVSLPAGSDTIGLLGSATSASCSGLGGPLTVTYTDGSTQQVPVTLSDWALGGGSCQPAAGDSVVAQEAYRNTSDGGQQALTVFLFSTTAALRAGKTVASVTLPTVPAGQLHVVAIGGAALSG